MLREHNAIAVNQMVETHRSTRPHPNHPSQPSSPRGAAGCAAYDHACAVTPGGRYTQSWSRKDSQQIAAAHFVLRSAQDESASWANQEDSARAVQKRTARNPGDHSADA